MIFNGFILVWLIFIHIFNGATIRDYFWIPDIVYLRLYISCYIEAYPFFFGLRQVSSEAVDKHLESTLFYIFQSE